MNRRFQTAAQGFATAYAIPCPQCRKRDAYSGAGTHCRLWAVAIGGHVSIFGRSRAWGWSTSWHASSGCQSDVERCLGASE